jgi:hypothetical protein
VLLVFVYIYINIFGRTKILGNKFARLCQDKECTPINGIQFCDVDVAVKEKRMHFCEKYKNANPLS